MSELTVLCVDDEEFVLKAIQRLLRKENFRILTATSGEDGLQILAREEIHVVASDQQMPGMPGSQFLAKVRRQYPDVVRFTVSGYADNAAIRTSIVVGGIDRFLAKPWNKDQLITNFGHCVDQFRVAARDRHFAKQSGTDPRVIQHLEMLRVRTVADLIAEEPFDVANIQRLPLPSITTDRNGMVVTTHEAIGRFWDNLAELRAGDDLLDIGVEAIVDPWHKAVDMKMSQTAVNGLIDGAAVVVRAVPLLIENHCEGCVVLIEPGATSDLPGSRDQACLVSS